MDKSKQAFPVPCEVQQGGMTLREHYAGLAMQGMCRDATILDSKALAECSVAFADALIARLEESE